MLRLASSGPKEASDIAEIGHRYYRKRHHVQKKLLPAPLGASRQQTLWRLRPMAGTVDAKMPQIRRCATEATADIVDGGGPSFMKMY